MSNDLRIQDDAPKGLILNARILWSFSAFYRYTQDDEDRVLARRAYEYLTERFLDQQHGGYFWELDPAGNVLDDKKKIYGQAFCIYALAEYYRTFNEPAALKQAIDVFDLIEAHASDSQYGGYFEVMSRDWRPCEDMRLSDKDMNEKKSMNNHLHVLEGYTNLVRVSPEPPICRAASGPDRGVPPAHRQLRADATFSTSSTRHGPPGPTATRSATTSKAVGCCARRPRCLAVAAGFSKRSVQLPGGEDGPGRA